MASQLSSDEVNRLCQDLVYQVSYAFYDTPYILLLKLLVQHAVLPERQFAEMLLITPNELRRYMGTLHVHRLVKRHVNKERTLNDNFRRPGQPPLAEGAIRTRDVHYWYLDYREFANVTKYRIAMMRKGIDEKIKQELGHRGYICPACSTIYEPLDLSHLFNPLTNSFTCENDGTELLEHDPSSDLHDGSGGGSSGNQDKMQRFNVATAPIRDALKAVEGITIPSLNVVVWIAQNVKTLPLPGEEQVDTTEKDKFKVVIGGEGDERAQLEKARLAEAQRTQNALPVWHTHSTVTGGATALGIKSQNTTISTTGHTRKESADAGMDDETALADHYANLIEDDEDGMEEVVDDGYGGGVSVKEEPDVVVKEERMEVPVPAVDIQPGTVLANGQNGVVDEDDEDEDEGMEGVVEDPSSTLPTSHGNGNGGGPMVMVGGVAKPLEEVTDEDQDLMSPDEYKAWYEAMEASM